MRGPLLRTLPLLLAVTVLCACRKRNPWRDTAACLDVPEDTTECPAAAGLDWNELDGSGTWCETEIQSIDGEGRLTQRRYEGVAYDDLICCYPASARPEDTNCIVD